MLEEYWVVPCQALHRSIGEEDRCGTHESSNKVCKTNGVKKAGHRIAGLGTVAQVLFKRSALRKPWLETWKVDTHKALCSCEDRRVQVETPEASYVSFDRVEDP